MELLSLTTFIAIMVPIIGGNMWLISHLFSKINLIGVRLNYVEEKEKFNTASILLLEGENKALREQRTKDFIEFTKVLADFSNSITEFRLSIKHLDDTLREVKQEIRNSNTTRQHES